MDNISKENGQELDLEAAQAVEWNDEASEALPDIFGNPVILKHILEQLPNSKLLELSLVNKLWKKEARIVMKKRGNVMALLKCDGDGGCGQVFQAFAANLKTLTETLYSGMTIWLHPLPRCYEIGALEVEAIHESILAGIGRKLKRLSIQLLCWNAQDCPTFLLLRFLLRDFARDLEHLSFKIEWTFENVMEQFMQHYLPHGPYPKLKVLKLKDVGCKSNQETFGNQIRLLLSRAPNLQEIHTYGRVSLRENLIEGREGVVHVHESDVHNVQAISENLIPALRLKRATFLYTTEPELTLDRFNEKARSLLKTCCAPTLEELCLEGVSGVLLFMSYGIRLLNVREIKIKHLDYVELEQLDPRIQSILTRFDFTYYLPKLKTVSIINHGYFTELSPSEMAAIIEQANNAARREPTLPRAGNTKSFRLDQSSVPVAAVEFFSQMFPAIEQICVYPEDNIFPVESAWSHWPHLEIISIGMFAFGGYYKRP